MSETDPRELEALRRENEELKKQLAVKTKLANRALASYQHRALHMEIIRQQNEDLDRLAADLAQANEEIEQRAKEVEQAARLKSEFLANFSHEIRTPLNGIIGYCNLLSREEGSRLTSHGRRDLGTIKSNAKTLLALINDILDLSKIESGHVDVVRETVDLGELYDECAATISELVKGKDIVVSAQIDELARRVSSDSLKIRQILLNLMSNAAKFTEVGEISVQVRAREETLVLVVEDTGAGISPDELPHIFEKFRQVDGSRTRRHGGTGLGLAIVRELSRILEGQVNVTSVLGRGSTFTVEIPGAIDSSLAERDSGRASDSERAESRLSGERVLVIDDDPMVLQLLRGQLEEESFQVLTASDGLSGLDLARKHRPTVVVLDIHLPRLDGWSVLSTLKSDADLSAIPVVILSVEEQRARGFSLGAFDYLVKPVEPDVLLDVVVRAIKPESGDVLVVDDDADTRELVGRRLRGEGFSVAEAATGQEAIDRFAKSAPALLVLDLVMPGVDGFEVLRSLRQRYSDVPVVVLTGKELSSEERSVLREGLTRVIEKGGTAIEALVTETRNLVVHQRAVELSKLPRVLYIEDIAQNRDIVRRYLHGAYQLLEAGDGESGLERARTERPDLILMDLSLPKMNGWECTKRLKATPELEKIPVVALTAHAASEDMERARAAGCAAYLTKPVDSDQLLGTIRQQLEWGGGACSPAS